jgi:hypothetical protein
MNRIRMLVKNLWDIAALTLEQGGAVGTLPLSNSQRYGKSLTAAITPAAGNSAVVFTLPEMSLASGLVIYRHWLSNAGKWRVELFDGPNATGTKVYDSALLDAVATKSLGELDWLVDPLIASPFDAWPFKFSQHWFAPQFFRSGRLTISDADGRDGLHEFDRIYLGQVFEPTVNFSWGVGHQWQSTERQYVTAAGSVFANERIKTREIKFTLDHLSELERPHLSAAIRTVGLSKDWFISLYPEAATVKEIEYAMSCKFTSLPGLTNTHFNNYAAPFAVREA